MYNKVGIKFYLTIGEGIMKKILFVFLVLFSVFLLGSCDKAYFKDGNIKTMLKTSDDVKKSVSEEIHNMYATAVVTVSVEKYDTVTQETNIFVDFDKRALEISVDDQKGAILLENGRYIGKGILGLTPDSDIEMKFQSMMSAPYVWNLKDVLESSVKSNSESLKDMGIKLDISSVLKKIQKSLVSEVFDDISEGNIRIYNPEPFEATVKAKIQGQKVVYRYTFETLDYSYTNFLLQGIRQKTTCVVEAAGESLSMYIDDLEGFEYNVHHYTPTYF